MSGREKIQVNGGIYKRASDGQHNCSLNPGRLTRLTGLTRLTRGSGGGRRRSRNHPEVQAQSHAGDYRHDVDQEDSGEAYNLFEKKSRV